MNRNYTTGSMKETIGIRLNELASEYVTLYFSEAQTEEYPYAVYTSPVTPVYTKDGIHHYEASVTVTVFDKILDQVNEISEHIRAAVIRNMNDGQYASRIENDTTGCTDEVWSREIFFTIKQYR